MQNGRSENPSFNRSERLFRRCPTEAVDEFEGRFRIIGQKAFDGHNQSTVRSLYSHPDHARWDSAKDPENEPGFIPQLYRDYYVVCISVADLPGPITSAGNQTHTFAPKHIPFEDNYAHSEIRAARDGTPVPEVKSKLVKTQYRTWLGDKASVCLRPGVVDPSLCTDPTSEPTVFAWLRMATSWVRNLIARLFGAA
jgi:hypothetical protein